MLDIQKIHEAIDAFIESNPTESYSVHIEKDDRQRPYLGLSGLGEKCVRKVWYQWRHCIKPSFPPRMKRLFRRGDREEFVFVWMLRGIGCTVYEVDERGKQFSVKDFSNHLSGHLDAVIIFPAEFWLEGFTPVPLLGEFKTANDAKYNECVKLGVEKWNSKYFTQMQGYCGYKKLTGAVFFAVNKNDDKLYIEYVPAKKSKFRLLVEKAGDIISAQAPPERVPFASPSLWDFKTKEGCKYCDALDICFKQASSPKMCRTCKFASPAENATWICEKGNEYGIACEQWEDIAKQ